MLTTKNNNLERILSSPLGVRLRHFLPTLLVSTFFLATATTARAAHVGNSCALYAGQPGKEMDGIHTTPYEHFGRLSYEMWRAARLAIDTGIHSQGWTRQQAVNFLADNTSLSEANVRAEVDRYISWPGQAPCYKVGEIKIWKLRTKTEKELGIRAEAFLDAVLANGLCPWGY